MNLRLLFTILLICSLCFNSVAQELPPITNYSSGEYKGGNQNWAITQSDNNYLYVANNEGLLEYNGENWNNYASPNGTILRCVLARNGKIYTGSYMDFGYWQSNVTGTLEYFSLGKNVYSEMIDDEHFWNIEAIGDWVLFQSLNRIYMYNIQKETISHINTLGIVNMFKIDDSIYFQDVKKGVFKITNGVSERYDALDLLIDNRIINIFNKNDELLILTETNGFFEHNKDGITKWEIPADKELEGESVYSGIELQDGSFAIGTISNGLLLLDPLGNLTYNLNQTNGLNNNTVLSVFEDNDENIWVGLDNGIDLINLKSPLKIFNDEKGKIGAVYTSKEYQGKLYVGTNQGLFYKDITTDIDFKFVAKTNGQVWDLFLHDNTLFCAHNLGTFVINNGDAQLTSSIPGTWNIQVIPNSPYLLQGNYAGLSVLEKKDGQWQLKNRINGFDYSGKFLEIDDENTLWINHEYKGVFKLKVDKEYRNITDVAIDSSAKKGKSSGLIKFDGKLLYASENGVLTYNREKNVFIKDSLLSSIFSNENKYTSGKMVVDSDDDLWLFTEKTVSYIGRGQFSKELIVHTLAIPRALRNSMIGYENISILNNGKYLLGTTSGYLIMDKTITEPHDNTIYLNSINVRGDNEDEVGFPIYNDLTSLKPDENTINFHYSVPDYSKFLTTEYQYFLEGYNSYWSNWTADNTVTFENLPPGDYNFKARSRTGNVLSSNEINAKFEIARPWYRTNMAIAGYILITILFFTGINSAYTGYYRRQRKVLLEKTSKDIELKELEAQKKIIQLRNNHLSLDIEARNRELAISTMNMIKKNETLNSIKDELGQLKDESGIRSVMKVIDKNLNNKEDWKFFEEAFNHADKDFFKKVKKIHPELTSNDLRLCVYLRMNLSSKEIAPLLNISHRSVEIKRYRLRKKISLSRDVNLNDYFIRL
ncbi:MAG: AraC family chitin signaling transcriptional activator [Cyclobacteriaceae bacterium]